jgi:phytanoyl-CoA hydroxylase
MLTEDQKSAFDEDGYLIFDGLLPSDRVAYYMSVFKDLVRQGKDLTEEAKHWTLEYDDQGAPIAGLVHKIQGVCQVDPRALELASEPVILDRVMALVGDDIDVFGTKFFPKLPDGGTSTHWHQDNFYFGTDTDRIISCATYLEPADSDNGCLRVVPGSHRSGIVKHEKNPKGHGSWTQVDDGEAVDVVCSAGTVVLFSANLLHGTEDNHSDRSSYRTAWHYMPGALNPERFPRGEYADRYTVRGS